MERLYECSVCEQRVPLVGQAAHATKHAVEDPTADVEWVPVGDEPLYECGLCGEQVSADAMEAHVATHVEESNGTFVPRWRRVEPDAA